MGNNVSSAFPTPILSSSSGAAEHFDISQCYDVNNEFLSEVFLQMNDQQADEELERSSAAIINLGELIAESFGHEEELASQQPPKKRRNNGLSLRARDAMGNYFELTPKRTVWWSAYCSDRNMQRSKSFDKKFRRRFRTVDV